MLHNFIGNLQMLISLNMYISPNTMRGKTALQIDYMSLGEIR